MLFRRGYFLWDAVHLAGRPWEGERAREALVCDLRWAEDELDRIFCLLALNFPTLFVFVSAGLSG